VCKNWKLQAERNRIWRRLSIRNYSWQDDEDTPASHAYRYWYHRYLVLLNSDRYYAPLYQIHFILPL
jgi:hypothetical protein